VIDNGQLRQLLALAFGPGIEDGDLVENAENRRGERLSAAYALGSK